MTTDASSIALSEGKTDLKTIYSDLATAGGKVLTLDANASVIRIYAFRGGRAAKLAHNHVLAAPQFTGFFYLPAGGASESRFDLEFRLDQLEIDNPANRAVLGSAFATVLSPADVAGSRKHMLGQENLQARPIPVRAHPFPENLWRWNKILPRRFRLNCTGRNVRCGFLSMS